MRQSDSNDSTTKPCTCHDRSSRKAKSASRASRVPPTPSRPPLTVAMPVM